jgi:RNA polymerase sigma factor (sigma-70 family)
MTLLHHTPAFVESIERDRRRAAARRRQPADAGEMARMLVAAASGDPSAWSALRERYAGRIRFVARRHRLAPHDVEDVLQTTWLRLLEHADRIREPRALGAWLETTARRESLRLLEATRREQATDHDFTDDGEDAPLHEQLSVGEQRAALAAALTVLPPRHQRLMSMLLAEPAPSYAEISRALDMPVGSIGPIRARCLARLRRDRELVRTLHENTA